MPTPAPNPALGITGLPDWYQDADGQQLAVCNVAGPCGVVAPDEQFYWSAAATIGNTDLLLAQEVALDPAAATPAAATAALASFGRVRITSRGADLVPGQWYRFTYPFGQREDLAVAGPGGRVVITSDVGCGAAIGLAACDGDPAFSLAGGSAVGPDFLQTDTGTTAQPLGFIGDAAIAHPVVGSTFFAPGETTPANYFRIDHITGPGGTVINTVGQTNLFIITGKLATSAAAPNGVPVGVLVNSDSQFGDHRIGAGPTTKTVTLRNGGSGSVDITAISVTGADAAQFTLGAGCAGNQELAPGASCSVPITFTPSGPAGPRAAAITVNAVVNPNVPAGVVKSFPLLGRATLPVLAVDPATAIDYGNQAVGTLTKRTVTVSNTGTATMAVSSATLGGASPGDYTLGLNTCNGASVAPGGQCTVDVFFSPTGNGVRAATLALATDVGPGAVGLTGVGVTLPVASIPPITTTPVIPPVVNVGPSVVPKLSLTRLTTSSRVKRSAAHKHGIRLVIGVPKGANVVRIRIVRKFSGGTVKLLSDGFKSPSKAGLYRVTQNFAALRSAFGSPGNYEVQVTPGTSRTSLGNTSRRTFKIIPG